MSKPWEFRRIDIEWMIEDYVNLSGRVEDLIFETYSFIERCIWMSVDNEYGFNLNDAREMQIKLNSAR